MPTSDSPTLHPRERSAYIIAAATIVAALITVTGGVLLLYLSHCWNHKTNAITLPAHIPRGAEDQDRLVEEEKAKFAALLEIKSSGIEKHKRKFATDMAEMRSAFAKRVLFLESQLAELKRNSKSDDLRKDVTETANQKLRGEVKRLQHDMEKLVAALEKLSRNHQLQKEENETLRQSLEKLQNDSKSLQDENKRLRRSVDQVSLLKERLSRLAKLEAALENLRATYKKKYDEWKNEDVLPQYQQVAIWNHKIIEKYCKQQMAGIAGRKSELEALRAAVKKHGADSSTVLDSMPSQLKVERPPQVYSVW